MDPLQIGAGENETVNSIPEFLSHWSPADPLFILLLIVAGAYVFGMARLTVRVGALPVPWHRIAFAAAGFAFLAFAIGGPSDVFAGEMFFAHMVQHLLIMMTAAPLLLAAGTMAAFMWALPETMRMGLGSTLSRRGRGRRLINLLTGPRFTLALFVVSLWGWHVPAAFNLALESAPVHLIMHLNMFVAGTLFWWPIIGPAPVRSRLSYPQRLLYLLMAVTPTAVLAAMITMSNSVLYDPYLEAPLHFGLEPEENQRIGGLLMWIPGNTVYLGAMTVLFFKWFEAEERKPRRPRRPLPDSYDASGGRNGASHG